MNRIALIIPYFTQTPPAWMKLYFLSCSKQNIDFLYYTDCEELIDQGKEIKNIKFVKCSFEEYCKRISDKLNTPPIHIKPYKLCDFRPFYGYIHQEELKKYDFWGYGDNDLVYGEMNMIIEDKFLRDYDIITTMADRIAGHFAIFRNNEKYRTLAFKHPKWREILTSEAHIGFDESGWVRLVLPEKRILTAIYKFLFKKIFTYEKWVSMTYKLYCNRLNRKFAKEMFTTPIPNVEDIWTYNINEGIVKDKNGRELPYLHFLFFKKTKYLKTDLFWGKDFWKIPNNNLDDYTNIYISLDGIKADI